MPQQTIQQRYPSAFPPADEPIAVIAALKAPDWVGKQFAVYRPLFSNESSPSGPVVAYGFDHPEAIEFITTRWFDQTGMSIEDLDTRAFENVWARPARWRAVTLPGALSDKPYTLLDCLDENAAERILHHDFMRAAHDMLHSPDLLAATPRRGVLLCVDGRDRDNAIKSLAVIAADQFQSGMSAPISGLIFEVRDGQIRGSIRVTVEGRPLTEPAAPAACAAPAPEPVPVRSEGLFAQPAPVEVGRDKFTTGARIGLVLLAIFLLRLLMR